MYSLLRSSHKNKVVTIMNIANTFENSVKNPKTKSKKGFLISEENSRKKLSKEKDNNIKKEKNRNKINFLLFIYPRKCFIAKNPDINRPKKTIVRMLKYLSIKTLILGPKK